MQRRYYEAIESAMDVYVHPNKERFGVHEVVADQGLRLVCDVDTRNYDGTHVWFPDHRGIRLYTLRQVCLVMAAESWYEAGLIEQSVVVYDGQDWQIVDQRQFARIYRARMHRDLFQQEMPTWNGKVIWWIN